tara:strand:+ start:309 stop:845 length:537 start_codon:yes stop_codon:yes gene_type:complete
MNNTNYQNLNFETMMKLRNGTVDIMERTPGASIPLYLNDENQDSYRTEAITNIHSQSQLNNMFFSQKNIDALQDYIRYEVYRKSNKEYTIGRQSDTELKIIMRSIYLQKAKHQEHNLAKQIQELNRLVAAEAVPNIMVAVEQYLGYKKKISTLPVPLAHPQYLSSAGTKSVRMDNFGF